MVELCGSTCKRTSSTEDYYFLLGHLHQYCQDHHHSYHLISASACPWPGWTSSSLGSVDHFGCWCWEADRLMGMFLKITDCNFHLELIDIDPYLPSDFQSSDSTDNLNFRDIVNSDRIGRVRLHLGCGCRHMHCCTCMFSLYIIVLRYKMVWKFSYFN